MDITISAEGKKVKIDGNVVILLNSYRQLGIMTPEAGGILIGRENIDTGNIIIEYATEPYGDDERNRYLFFRKDKNHLQIFNNLYRDNKGIYAYIGEWHTHPEDYPNYSSKDIINWKKIAKSNEHEDRSYFHIIVGNKVMRIWEYRLGYNKAKNIY